MASPEQMTDWLQQARMADDKPMSNERLSEVFDYVRSPEGWKMPIAALVPKDKATREEIEAAVAWYAGGHPEVADHGPHWYVTGAGYYEWVGA